MLRLAMISLFLFSSAKSMAAISSSELELDQKPIFSKHKPLALAKKEDASAFSDVPITYNREVQKWVKYFQGRGRTWFKTWLERSNRHKALIHGKLSEAGLPKDLIYLAMIESGFSFRAVSHASAVGPWQFIAPTAKQYGLEINHWKDERRDFNKSTDAAIKYLKRLYKEFGNWYLVGAAYNTGEGRVRRQIKRYKTNSFWVLSRKRAFVEETKNYIPKFIAALLIAKAPHLYGFDNLNPHYEVPTDQVLVPPGTDLKEIARHLKVTLRAMKEMNPELLHARIPNNVSPQVIRVPKGAANKVSQFTAQMYP